MKSSETVLGLPCQLDLNGDAEETGEAGDGRGVNRWPGVFGDRVALLAVVGGDVSGLTGWDAAPDLPWTGSAAVLLLLTWAPPSGSCE